jgi:hypothetical protein
MNDFVGIFVPIDTALFEFAIFPVIIIVILCKSLM